MVEFLPSRTVAVSILGMSIYWYGLLYVLAFWLTWSLLPRLQKYRGLSLSREQWTYIAAWGAAGVIVGGRLGYALLYEPAYFASHPFDLFVLRGGGMSSHGGFIGVWLALWYAGRQLRVPLLALTDIIVIPAAIGLALGRLGNFVNQELYGTPTALPWGVSIPAVEGRRHPTQLYAMAKNCLIALVCWPQLRKAAHRPLAGSTTALFLIMYSVLRFSVEFVRVQEWPLVFGLTRGQLYTIPLFIVGFLLWVKIRKTWVRGD